VGPKTDDLDRIDAEETLETEGEETAASPKVQATRTQIEETRAEMSETIDAIRDKLNSQTLADHAKETVSEITSNVMEKAKSTAHDVVENAKQSVHETLQEAKETLPKVTANVAHQAVSGAVTEAKEAVGSAVSTAKHAMGDAAGTAKNAGATLMDAIRQNPVPAALIALGVGWLWATNRGSGNPKNAWDVRRYRTPYDEGTWGARSYTGAYTESSSGPDRPMSHSAKATDNSPAVGERIGHAAERVKESAGDLTQRVQGTVSHAAEKVGDTVSHVGARTSDYARGMAMNCQTMLEERPLALGAIALGVGAAIGLLVPGTYREDRLMGEMRDQIVGKVSDSAQDLALRAQVVAEEAIGSAKETAKEEARQQGLAG
jgi:ElaB/YqjD/DUF883 family membrane-anchored ribosome-binding protein/gas vesicle protein